MNNISAYHHFLMPMPVLGEASVCAGNRERICVIVRYPREMRFDPCMIAFQTLVPTMVGGMIFSTVLTLIVIPAIYPPVKEVGIRRGATT